MIKIDKENLKLGMEVAVDIYDNNGNILISKHTKLNEFHLKKLSAFVALKYVYIISGARTQTSATSAGEEAAASDAPSGTEERDAPGFSEIPVEQIRSAVFKKIKSNLDSFSEQSASNFAILFQVVEQIIEKILSFDSLVYEINRMQSSDDYLYNHSINTTILSILIGISMGFKSNDLYSLGKGAFFSDIGKLQIDPLLLLKPGELTADEFEQVKKYPEYGYRFMKHFPEMDENALDCILHAREKYDGTGYPHGLKNDEISIFAKIVGLASYFDALCNDRHHKSALSPYKAMSKAFDEVNTHFDADLLKKTVKILGYYDVGMFVELQSSDLAKIVRCARHKPLLKIIQTSIVNNSSHTYEIDMAKNPSVKIKDVLVKSEYDRLQNYI